MLLSFLSSIYLALKYSWVLGQESNGSAFNSQPTEKAELTHLTTLKISFVSFTLSKILIFLTSLLLQQRGTRPFCPGSFHICIYFMSSAAADISALGSGKHSETFFFPVNSYFSSCQSAEISEMTSLRWEQRARKGGTASFKGEKSVLLKNTFLWLVLQAGRRMLPFCRWVK